MFVVLFGLSMDYHVFILTRVRELYDRGMKTEDAVSTAIKSTAGVVTSAAFVMVCVFAVFGTLSWMMFKQMGVGLAFAVFARRDAHPRGAAARDDEAARRLELVAARLDELAADDRARGRGAAGEGVALASPNHVRPRRPPSPAGAGRRAGCGACMRGRPVQGRVPDGSGPRDLRAAC